jgi:hypothetical protein
VDARLFFDDNVTLSGTQAVKTLGRNGSLIYARNHPSPRRPTTASVPQYAERTKGLNPATNVTLFGTTKSNWHTLDRVAHTREA